MNIPYALVLSGLIHLTALTIYSPGEEWIWREKTSAAVPVWLENSAAELPRFFPARSRRERVVSPAFSERGREKVAVPAPARGGEPRTLDLSVADFVAEGNEKPIYPEEARLQGWEGNVRLKIAFRRLADSSVEIENSSGYSLLDEAAKSAAVRWRLPANFYQRRGMGVEAPVDVRVSVAFRLVDEES